jgi:hypothetical protein
MTDDVIIYLMWGFDLLLALVFAIFARSVKSPTKRWLFGLLAVLALVPLPIVKCDTMLVPGWMLLLLMLWSG